MLHLYQFAYCNNNPVIFIDPTGHHPIPWIDIYGRYRVDDPCDPDFKYDISTIECYDNLQRAGFDFVGHPVTLRSPDERASTIRDRYNELAGGEYYGPDDLVADTMLGTVAFVGVVSGFIPGFGLLCALCTVNAFIVGEARNLHKNIEKYNKSQQIFEKQQV